MDTLFAHLAVRLAASPENVAIEALGFVLSRSAAARKALTELAGLGNALALPADLSFATQAGDEADDARPDIEATDGDFRRRCVVECKFWAGLTENQPTAYARRLIVGEAGALVFVVPSARMTMLWAELTERLKTDGYTLGRRAFRTDEVWFTRLTAAHGFVLVSWRSVMDAIARAMDAAGEHETRGDLEQLAGLCERMDAEAFLPLRSEELTGVEQPRRILELGQLAVDIGTELIRLGVAAGRTPAAKLTTAGGPGFFGRHLYAHGVTFFLSLDCAAWAAYRSSPLWLRVEAQRFPQAAARLVRDGGAQLGRDVVIERGQAVLVPLPLRHGVERPQLVEEAAAFAARVIALFGEGEATGAPSLDAAPPAASLLPADGDGGTADPAAPDTATLP